MNDKVEDNGHDIESTIPSLLKDQLSKRLRTQRVDISFPGLLTDIFTARLSWVELVFCPEEL